MAKSIVPEPFLIVNDMSDLYQASMNTSSLVLISVIILILLARTLLFPVQGGGRSMYPTYRLGARLLALPCWLRWRETGVILAKRPCCMKTVEKSYFACPPQISHPQQKNR
jgi:hypothetical protein